MESAEAAAAAHTSLLYGMSKNQNQIITMAKRDKGSYHKEPVRAQSEKRKILQSVGFVKTKTIYTQKKKIITKTLRSVYIQILKYVFSGPFSNFDRH